MPEARITKGWIWEDGGGIAISRIINESGAYITQASLTSITCKVYDLDNADALVGTPTVTISTSVFDTLQAAAADLRLWTRDGVQIDNVGWNFKFVVPASFFPLGSYVVDGVEKRPYRSYRVEFLFDPTSGENFFDVYEPKARKVLQS